MTAWNDVTPIGEVCYLYSQWDVAYHWNVRNEHLEADVTIDDEDSFPFLKVALVCRLIDERKT